jgi:hypothetical protein
VQRHGITGIVKSLPERMIRIGDEIGHLDHDPVGIGCRPAVARGVDDSRRWSFAMVGGYIVYGAAPCVRQPTDLSTIIRLGV